MPLNCLLMKERKKVISYPYPTRLPELCKGPRGGKICLTHCKPPKSNVKPIFPFFWLFESLSKFRNCHQAVLKN